METNLTPFLTPKQKLFCDEYLTDRNATRAALRAGYSRDTAMNGYLMTLPKIKLYLEQQMETIAQEAQVSHAQILHELSKIAFGNMGNFFDADGGIKPMNDVGEDDKAALWSVSVSDAGSGATATSITKFRMYNKLSALDKIARHINFYKPQATEPKIVYKYVTTADITEDDTFDDPILQKEIMEREMSGTEKEDMEKWEVLKKEYGVDSIEYVVKNQEGEDESMENDLIVGDVMQLPNAQEELAVKVVEPEVAHGNMVRPNFDMMGLSGRKLSEQERAERKKYRSYWIK